MAINDSISTGVCCATLYDRNFAILGGLCRSSLIRYGRRHRMDVMFSEGNGGSRPRPWEKIPFILALFELGYEFVFWVDADAIIVDVGLDIRDTILPEKHLYLVRHLIEGRLSPNTGVMLLRNCDWTQCLLKKLWCLEQYIDHSMWENAALLHVLSRDEYVDMGILNDGELLSQDSIRWLDERWNYLPRISTQARPIIKHYAGRRFNSRKKHMVFQTNWIHHFYASLRYRFATDRSSEFPVQRCFDVLTGRRLAKDRAA